MNKFCFKKYFIEDMIVRLFVSLFSHALCTNPYCAFTIENFVLSIKKKSEVITGIISTNLQYIKNTYYNFELTCNRH